jgi:hypothetical protein
VIYGEKESLQFDGRYRFLSIFCHFPAVSHDSVVPEKNRLTLNALLMGIHDQPHGHGIDIALI